MRTLIFRTMRCCFHNVVISSVSVIQLLKNRYTRKVCFEIHCQFLCRVCSASRCARVSSFCWLEVFRRRLFLERSQSSTCQHVALVSAATELAGEFKDAFEESDRVNKVFLEFG